MAEFEIKHIKAPHYATSVATGVALGGPTGDGFIHLTFFRDIFSLQHERFESVETRAVGTATEVKLGRPIPTHAPIEREDVASVSLPLDKLQSFADALANHAKMIKGDSQASE